MRALTEFLERELRALLVDEVAAVVDGSEDSESQSQSQSQSQAGIAVITPLAEQLRPRVVVVSATSPSEQMLTLADRSRMVDAFVPQHVIATQVLQKYRYASLAPLRGSVVRIDRYHFATAQRCERAASATWTPARRARTRVDELTVIDKSDLAVNAAPVVDELPHIMQLLDTLSDEQLDARVAARQGLPPLAGAVAERIYSDTEYLLRDDDCIIPEDQEAQLAAQDGWGQPTVPQPQPSDSQLIAENGSEPLSQSQAPLEHDSDGIDIDNEMERTAASVPELQCDTREPVVPAATATQAQLTPVRHGGSGTCSEVSSTVPVSQGFEFQAENLQTAFVHCSDTESESSSDAEAERPANQHSVRPRSCFATQVSETASAVAVPVASVDANAESTEPLTASNFEHVEPPVDSVAQSTKQQSVTSVDESEGLNDDDAAASQDAFVDDPCGDGGFPQTQAPESQEGFPDADDADGNDENDGVAESVDVNESNTQMLVNAPAVMQAEFVDYPEQVVENIRGDDADKDNDDGSRSDGGVVEPRLDVSVEPLTQAPDSIDDVTMESPIASPRYELPAEPLTQAPDSVNDDRLESPVVSPLRSKRPREPMTFNDENSGRTTPPATQSDDDGDTVIMTAIDAPSHKAPRTARSSSSCEEPTTAELAVMSYFRTGVPLAIQQRDERTQVESAARRPRAADAPRWLVMRSTAERRSGQPLSRHAHPAH